MRRWAVTLAALAVSGIASGQTNAPLKVYISADMEGVGGVSTWDKQSGPEGADSQQFRRLMSTRNLRRMISATKAQSGKPLGVSRLQTTS